MKFEVGITLVSTVLSQTDDSVDQRKLSHVMAMSYNQVSTAHSQTIFGKMLLNYGCHCFPDSGRSMKAVAGQGPPQDDYTKCLNLKVENTTFFYNSHQFSRFPRFSMKTFHSICVRLPLPKTRQMPPLHRDGLA